MRSQSLVKGLALLSISALLFSTMGVLIRLASHSVDNTTIVFMRNLTGTLLLLPFALLQGASFFKTDKFYMHAWRAIVGLIAMYGFFYAIAHLPLSNAMVFTYSSPVFIPLVAWLFLKERISGWMLLAAGIGLLGVMLVSKPNEGLFNWLSLVGLSSSFLAAMAFVTVRALTQTEPATRIVFYFCLISTVISAIPMYWSWRLLSLHELGYVIGAGTLATLSQVCLSKAYGYAPAGKIGPANYLAIIFAGLWAWLLWDERPDRLAIIGMMLIFIALLLCLPREKAAPTPLD
ncbi:EamA domain-containing membrane protein RarD [Agitococcus lubricus]|uniref:EamA domain-containing membrane protein RarD n=2 Tax=Agitococcus lubricus TaxID=1077255 RepID=A0A2T5J2F9_9GAMM|nr:DMT family transporter [Agitococcus lubricus]PTQ90701.1 EamA domain-containing membrane protein RarD [Agitococcus lubricus]